MRESDPGEKTHLLDGTKRSEIENLTFKSQNKVRLVKHDRRFEQQGVQC